MTAIHKDTCAFAQGEVELISQMKPRGSDLSDTGLLEYLEEIIGSDKYVESIKQLSEQLEAATSERDTMERRIRSVEQEADQLAQRKGDAERYLQQKANCIRLKIQRSAYTTFHLKVAEAASPFMYENLCRCLPAENRRFEREARCLAQRDGTLCSTVRRIAGPDGSLQNRKPVDGKEMQTTGQSAAMPKCVSMH